MREWIGAQAPDRSEEEVRVLARAAAGRLDRARRLLDPDAAARRDATHLVADDPHLAGHTALAAAVADRVTGETERFLERA